MEIQEKDPWLDAINGPNPYILPFKLDNYKWKCMYCRGVFGDIAKHWHEFHSKNGHKNNHLLLQEFDISLHIENNEENKFSVENACILTYDKIQFNTRKMLYNHFKIYFKQQFRAKTNISKNEIMKIIIIVSLY